jgi:hypothetical protein
MPNGVIKKKVILKGERPALRHWSKESILAKKGIWVSEFRIESGLNCGGHAFATDGVLMGPILEEFKEKRAAVSAELHALCSAALAEGGHHPLPASPEIRITVQGGIGTTAEDEFLREHYGMDGTGWGSPFLLVPEATNVEDKTLAATFRCAKKEDYYMSWASPLGDPLPQFPPQHFRSPTQGPHRQNRPGSPCYKKFLSTNTEFTEIPICTASRQYQDLKLKQLDEQKLDPISQGYVARRASPKRIASAKVWGRARC